jgi:lipopolysaccharide/colanic/teichoic acid biosynthesis glycosyltransferase
MAGTVNSAPGRAGVRFVEKPAYEAVKRAFDILASGVALVVASPLMLAIAIAVRLESPGPALFRQVRVGRGERRFRLMKFRTMRAGEHARGDAGRVLVDEPVAASDLAITRLGRFLRASSLDELPQLVNIFKGDLSLVGPRATIPEQTDAYGPREKMRLSVQQGLTGLAQVRGRNALSWPERIEIDLEYVERRSFWFDLSIILRTPWSLVSGRGIYMRK